MGVGGWVQSGLSQQASQAPNKQLSDVHWLAFLQCLRANWAQRRSRNVVKIHCDGGEKQRTLAQTQTKDQTHNQTQIQTQTLDQTLTQNQDQTQTQT